MHYLKMIGLTAAGAMALMAFGAGSASATTMELTAATQNQAVEITATLKAGTSMTWKKTDGTPINACTESHLTGKTEEPFTTAGVGGPLTALSFGKCSIEGVKVDKAGSFNIEHIASTTNGTVRSIGAEITVPMPGGIVLNCKTGTGAHIGTLTGSAAGNATLDINAVINCGLVASVSWVGEYTITSPTKLGVSS